MSVAGGPNSTNFDDDQEEGEISSSPPRAEDYSTAEEGEIVAVSSSVVKGTEIHIDDDVMIDRTESSPSLVIDPSDPPSESSVNDSKWYTSMRRSLLNGLGNEYTEDEPKSKRPKLSACFNCGGDHQISNCPVEKDQQRIKKAHQEFKEKKRQSEGARLYTEDAPTRASEFRPGRISNTLRTALGIGSDDIPEWVYRMRKLGFIKGYPPGYLRQAIEHNGREEETLQFHLVDEELNENKKREKREESPPPVLNRRKIFYYMGFNNTYKRLNDRERGKFKVPPFDDFCGFLDDHLKNKYWKERTERKKQKEAIKESKEDEIICLTPAEKPLEEDDDIIIIDRKPTALSELESSERQARVVLNEELNTSTNEFNTATILGTPVSSRKNRRGESNSIPTLEEFSKGITPFTAQEEVGPRRNGGFISFLKSQMKKLREG